MLQCKPSLHTMYKYSPTEKIWQKPSTNKGMLMLTFQHCWARQPFLDSCPGLLHVELWAGQSTAINQELCSLRPKIMSFLTVSVSPSRFHHSIKSTQNHYLLPVIASWWKEKKNQVSMVKWNKKQISSEIYVVVSVDVLVGLIYSGEIYLNKMADWLGDLLKKLIRFLRGFLIQILFCSVWKKCQPVWGLLPILKKPALFLQRN